MQPPLMPTPKTDGGFSEVSLVGETTPTTKQTGKLLLKPHLFLGYDYKFG